MNLMFTKSDKTMTKQGSKVWKTSERFKTKSFAVLQLTLASDRLAKEMGLAGSWELESRVIRSPDGSGYVYQYRKCKM